jgi:hypothetical protein
MQDSIKVKSCIRYLLIAIGLTILFAVDAITAAKQDNPITALRKIDDFPLYCLNYSGDYSFDKFLRHGAKDIQELNRFLLTNKLITRELQGGQDGACSCFTATSQSGEVLFGRNYDLPGKPPILMLYTHPSNGYASISMVNLNTLKNSTSKKDTDNNIIANLSAAPYFPADGMNEPGVAVAILSVPAASFQPNPMNVSILRWQVTRLILDYARNVDEAIALISKYNVNVKAFGTFIHYFVADASGNSAVIEFVAGKMRVIRGEKPWQTVTNFILYNNFGDAGRKRYVRLNRILTANHGLLAEIEAMDLLRSVSLDTTVWSAVYNLRNKEVCLSLGRHYAQKKKFSVKTITSSK